MSFASGTVTINSAGGLPVSVAHLLSFQTAAQPQPAAQLPSWYRNFSTMLHPMLLTVLLVIYPSLIGHLQLKYQTKAEAVFETHSVFMYMSLAAIIIFAMAYSMSFLISENSNTNQLSHSRAHMVVVSVAFISIVIALLSLVFALILPPKLMWIGLAAMGLFVIVITAYACLKHLKSIGKIILKEISKLVDYIKKKF